MAQITTGLSFPLDEKRGSRHVMVQEPAAFRSPVWRDRAQQVQAVMNDFWEGRQTALSEYLKQRA